MTKTLYNDALNNLLADKDNSKIKSFDDALMFATCLNRECSITDEITEEIGDAVDSYIRFWNQVDDENDTPVKEREPIKLYIDTPGGSLSGSFTMINSIAQSKTPVWTINTGNAYSGGFFIFIAGHKRIAYSLSSFLYHEGSVQSGGDAGKFRNFSKFYEVQLSQLKNIVLKYTKISEEEYERHIKDDWWFTASEALKYGICDEIKEELH
jgi:ATP-dependent Clp protease protease subunit